MDFQQKKYVLCLALVGSLLASSAQAEVANWNQPNIDTWTYPAPETPGTRTLGPTFLTSPALDEFDQFVPSTSRDPARRGMSFAIFDTSTQIQAGLSPVRYQINSVTVTFTMQEGTAGQVRYDDTPDTNAELLADYVNDDIDTARPMELYGVAQQAGYTGYNFGSGGGGDQPFAEGDHPYSPTGASGLLSNYPIASDAQGNYVDVSNSFTGGYSATAPGNTTAPFDPVPWSIGTAAGLNPGDVIPDSTTFDFNLDLQLPGVTEYVQSGLEEGALGFYLSSLHFSGNPHGGSTIPYPQWYLKEFNSLFGGVPPTLEVDYTILPLPGDFDEDEDVDAFDLSEWAGDFGLNGDSDANSDGSTDGADFLLWQQHYTGEPSAGVANVPEPLALSIALFAAGSGLLIRRQGRTAGENA